MVEGEGRDGGEWVNRPPSQIDGNEEKDYRDGAEDAVREETEGWSKEREVSGVGAEGGGVGGGHRDR